MNHSDTLARCASRGPDHFKFVIRSYDQDRLALSWGGYTVASLERDSDLIAWLGLAAVLIGCLSLGARPSMEAAPSHPVQSLIRLRTRAWIGILGIMSANEVLTSAVARLFNFSGASELLPC